MDWQNITAAPVAAITSPMPVKKKMPEQRRTTEIIIRGIADLFIQTSVKPALAGHMFNILF
jgi:hypothetical protein